MTSEYYNEQTNTMISTSESAVRRRAKARGMRLIKSRGRCKECRGYGTFALTGPYSNTLVVGGHLDGYGATLEECAKYIDRQPILKQ
jgi:hypothetical protein